MADAAFIEMTTVARYAQSRDGLTAAERDRRVQVIADFAEQPDWMRTP